MNPPFLESSYSSWEPDVYRWKDVDDFRSAPELLDGLHRIDLMHAPPLEILISGAPFQDNQQGPLPVFFSGAITNRKKSTGPFFSGRSISNALKTAFISISDPSVNLHPTVGLGWYIGNKFMPLRETIASLLLDLRGRANRKLLLVGGSAGGFAALYYGYSLGRACDVFAWNPQTEVLRYDPEFTKNFLTHAFFDGDDSVLSGPNWRELAKSAMLECGVTSSVVDLAADGEAPARVLILQNSTDWHVVPHTAPFIDAAQYAEVSHGVYATDPEHVVWIATFGDGHAAPSPEIVQTIMTQLLQPDQPVQTSVQHLSASRIFGAQRIGTLPRNLTDLREIIRSELSLIAYQHENDLQLHVLLGSVPANYGGISFGFFEVVGEQIRVLRWYTDETTLRTNPADATPGASYMVRVRDGFGHILFDMYPNKKAAINLKVFVYGSCVSRDPFELPGPFQLRGYVARSSLGGAFAPPVTDWSSEIDLEQIPSAFQKRMVLNDLEKRIGAEVATTEFDFFVMDFIDERLPLFAFRESFLTYSVELQRAGFSPDPDSLVQPGSDVYWTLWDEGLTKLLAAVSAQKIVVNRVYWATHDTSGNLLSDQESIEKNNRVLTSIYSRLANIPGIRFVSYPDGLLLADTAHRWGLAPFHYSNHVNNFFLKELEKLAV